MILEFTEDILRSNIPATFAPVAGERPLVERLAPFLEEAAASLELFTGDVIPAPILDDFIFSRSWYRAVSLLALDRAVPALDLILTPNGFATVGNSQVVPASAARTSALRESCRDGAALSVQQLIRRLSLSPEWLETPAGRTESGCLAVGLSFDYHGDPEWKLSEHTGMRARIMHNQDTLAENYFSFPLIRALAREAHTLQRDIPQIRRRVMYSITLALRNLSLFDRCPVERMLDIAGTINSFPDIFPEYAGSDARALIFDSVRYENKKSSSAFYF